MKDKFHSSINSFAGLILFVRYGPSMDGPYQIEELFGLIEYEADSDIGGMTDAQVCGTTPQGPSSQVGDSNNSEPEDEDDKSLDKEIREKNARNREKTIQKYGQQHTVITFETRDVTMLRIPT